MTTTERSVLVQSPTTDLRGAHMLLGWSEWKIRAAIDDGRIGWAWNIGRDMTSRIELRLLSAAVTDLLSPYGGEPIERAAEEVIALIHGAHRPFIYGREWCDAWSCNSDHMIRLLNDGSLRLAAGSDRWRRGPGGSPCIAWESAVRFIDRRRIV